jgi:hypothetical protein
MTDIQKLISILKIADACNMILAHRWGGIVFNPKSKVSLDIDQQLKVLGCEWDPNLKIYLFDLGDQYE